METPSERTESPQRGVWVAAAAIFTLSLDTVVLAVMFVVLLAALVTYLIYRGPAGEPGNQASGPSPSTPAGHAPVEAEVTRASPKALKGAPQAETERRRATLCVAVVAVIVLAGLGGYGLGFLGAAPASGGGASGPYRITLIETMNNMLGGAMQPMFEVVTSEGLGSSANISLPAHTLIVMTIVSYDTPTPGSAGAYSNVTATVGNKIVLVNGTSATGSGNASMGSWESNVSIIPASQLAHTFTVSALGLNIPVEGGFTEVAYFYINETGSFTWLCMTPCGTGPNGSGGAMATPGWMMGTLFIQ